MLSTGRNNPYNAIKDKYKHVDVNFYKLIVTAPTFIKYLLISNTPWLLQFQV